ncbi:MAG: DUF262 domain-containing protein [Bacteroidales bacterium]|nr:DUF262 domain-containing protein [Bacteroidales bacterium]
MTKRDTQRLENEITEQSNMLKTERMDISFGELMSMYENEEIIIKPAFQRYFRWSDEQKTRFIESLLLGIPIPPIFVATNGQGVWELVDGLQRISTFLSFVGILKKPESSQKERPWALQQGDRIKSMEGFTYETLPQKFRFNLKRSVCRVEILKWDSSYDMRYELFNRLNTGGTPLTQQEIRNCIFRDISPIFNDFLKKLVKNDDFKKSLNLSYEQTQCLYDEELVLRFVSLYNENDIKNSISLHMTKFMESALRNPRFEYAMYKKVFEETFAILVKLGSGIFRQANGDFATSLYDVITYGISHNIEKYKNMSTQSILDIINNKLRRDENFLRFSRRGGNNQRERIINRLKVAKEIF